MNLPSIALCVILTIICTAAFACDQSAISITSNPIREQSEETYQQSVVIADAANKIVSPEIVIIGDSLVSRWPIGLLEFPSKNLHAFNMGVEGDKTQNLLWRLNNKAFIHLNPKIVVLLIGTNNLAAGDSACAISSAIDKIVSRIDSLWGHPKLILLPLLPRGDGWAFRLRDREQINKSLNEIARSRENTKLLNYGEELTCYLKWPCQNFIYDKLHLSPEGYILISSYLEKYLLDSK